MSGNQSRVQGLSIPPSQNVVDVFVIDSTARIQMPIGFFVKGPLPGHEMMEVPSFVFLVQNAQGKKILFDLGLRTDIESLPPVIQQGLPISPMKAAKGIATILKEDGNIALDEIDSIIWSHWHVDHVGDPSTFPSTVDLVVGPGAKDMLLPGYPANPNGFILESDYSGRQFREIDFETGLQIGHFRAMDFFGDGSFYLLDAPGHAAGHMCALARTTPSTFIFLGGDGCHHVSCLRPNQYLPLPKEISPSPFSSPPYSGNTTCPGTLLAAIHPKHSYTEPYYNELSEAPTRDVAAAEAVIKKMIPFDANEDVFTIIAHDTSLLSVIDLFPKKANQWKEKGWKEASRWGFLRDFTEAVTSYQKSTA